MRKGAFISGLVLILLLPSSIQSQSKITQKESRADKHYQQQSYYKAWNLYEKVINKNPGNERAKLKLARTYYESGHVESAHSYYSQVINKRYLVKSIDYLNYALILQSMEQFESSEKWARKYLKINPRSVIAQNLVHSLENLDQYYKDSIRYVVTAMNINSQAADFSPAFYNDGLVFVSSRSKKGSLKRNYSRDNSKFLNLYYTEGLIGSTIWTEPVKLPGQINDKYHQGPASFFNNGTEVIYTSNDSKATDASVNNLRLYHASYSETSSKWKVTGQLPISHENYSTGHPTIDEDNQVLYFVSDKPGGQGGTDIYKVHFDGSEWGNPVNLGPEINTPGDEMFPYLDGQHRLYFSSNGHGGLGGLDIFYVDLDDPVRQVFNPGFPINSPRDDYGIIVDDESGDGFFSSERGGQTNLYQFRETGHLLKVLVYDDSLNPLPTRVSVHSSQSTESTDIAGGEYAAFVLSPGENYELRAESSGYKVIHNTIGMANDDIDIILQMEPDKQEPISATLLKVVTSTNTRSYVLTDDKVIEVKENATPSWLETLLMENNIIIEQTVSINPILYHFDQTAIQEKYEDELIKLAELMKKYEFLEFELGAHTDSIGSDVYNEQLSQLRANAALNYLKALDIENERLLAVGYGESNLTNRCDDHHPCKVEEHRVNRRTEFRLIYMDENQVVSNY